MDNKKLEQLAQSDYFDMVKELIDEFVEDILIKPYESRVAEEVALEALSREKAIKVVRDLIGLVERSVANRKEGERRSFK